MEQTDSERAKQDEENRIHRAEIVNLISSSGKLSGSRINASFSSSWSLNDGDEQRDHINSNLLINTAAQSTNTSYHDLPDTLNENFKNEKLKVFSPNQPLKENSLLIKVESKPEDSTASAGFNRASSSLQAPQPMLSSRNLNSSFGSNSCAASGGMILKTLCCNDTVKTTSMHSAGRITPDPNCQYLIQNTCSSSSTRPTGNYCACCCRANMIDTIYNNCHQSNPAAYRTQHFSCSYEHKPTQPTQNSEQLKYKGNTCCESNPSASLHNNNNNIKRDTYCQSAFENDSDLLLYKASSTEINNNNNTESNGGGNNSNQISLITRKYLSYNNLFLPMESTKSDVAASSTTNKLPESHTDNDFFNLISLKLKKNEESSQERPSRHQVGHVEIPVHYEEEIEEEEESTTQLDSEYTRAPVFPSHAYGSRPSPPPLTTPAFDSANSMSCRSSNVIYNRKANNHIGSTNKSSYLFDEESSVLDPECLKSVDRKLRSMMKKTKECLDEIELNASNTSNIIDESLRDIPVHDMVKKLRREFEVSGDVESLNAGLDNLWQKIQDHQTKYSDSTSKHYHLSPSTTSKSRRQDTQNNLQTPTKTSTETPMPKSIMKTTTTPTALANTSSASSFKNIPKYIDQTLMDDEEETSPHVVAAGGSAGSSSHCSPNDQERMVISKQRLNDMVIERKNKHEKRIQILEKLIQVEKLHASKLRKILRLSQDEDEFLCDSLLEKLDDLNLTSLSAYKQQDKMVDEVVEEKTTKIELNAVNESVRDKSPSTSRSEKQHEEVRSQPVEIKIRYPLPKPASWFFPIDGTHHSVHSNHSYEENECADHHHHHRIDLHTPEHHFDCWCTLQKMSLQEAFRLYKYDLISRSRDRQREIKLKEARRRVESEIKTQTTTMRRKLTSKERIHDHRIKNDELYRLKLNRQSLKTSKARNSQECQTRKLPPRYFFIDHQNPSTVLSKKEIKEQTRRKYANLPEVKQRQIKEKMEEAKKANRIRSEIYKNAILQKVLSEGPNFKRNFKAIQ